MKKECIELVYINNVYGSKNVLKTLKKHGGVNKRNWDGRGKYIYYISPEGIIDVLHEDHIPLLIIAGYKEIPVEEPIEEFTIEEIAKLLGKDPDSIRIKK